MHSYMYRYLQQLNISFSGLDQYELETNLSFFPTHGNMLTIFYRQQLHEYSVYHLWPFLLLNVDYTQNMISIANST